MKDRLDKILVTKNLVSTRSQAKQLIEAGHVVVDNKIVDKVSTEISLECLIEIKAPIFVGRGAIKLENALKDFSIDVANLVVMDVGASTGGFCEILLKYNVKKIIAVDVGTNQLHPKIKDDPKVVNKEQTHILHLQPGELDELVDGFVIDLSFISLKKILSHLQKLGKKNAFVVALIKPQFEIGIELLPKDGVLKSIEHIQMVLDDFKSFILEQGWEIKNLVPCSIQGKTGNQEYFIYFKF